MRLDRAVLAVLGALSGSVACGGALPSAAPLSTPVSHRFERTRPSSARAVEVTPEEHKETPEPAESDDDDDDDGDDSASALPHSSVTAPR